MPVVMKFKLKIILLLKPKYEYTQGNWSNKFFFFAKFRTQIRIKYQVLLLCTITY